MIRIVEATVPQLFISYAHEDKADAQFVRNVINQTSRSLTAGEKALAITTVVASPLKLAALKVRGKSMLDDAQFTAWMDVDIAAGADWNKKIEQAIKNCAAFVVLVPRSPSPSVAIECGVAMTKKKSVIPITRSMSDLASYQLGRFQALAWPDHTADWTNKLRTAIFGVTQGAVRDDLLARGTLYDK